MKAGFDWKSAKRITPSDSWLFFSFLDNVDEE